MKSSKRRFLGQAGHQEGKLVGRVSLYCNTEGKVWQSIGFFFDSEPQDKATIRQTDRVWVCKNIPSTMWWGSEVHHDWDNGGVMYILTLKEHKRRDKK
jgi:hypothetical protein